MDDYNLKNITYYQNKNNLVIAIGLELDKKIPFFGFRDFKREVEKACERKKIPFDAMNISNSNTELMIKFKSLGNDAPFLTMVLQMQPSVFSDFIFDLFPESLSKTDITRRIELIAETGPRVGLERR